MNARVAVLQRRSQGRNGIVSEFGQRLGSTGSAYRYLQGPTDSPRGRTFQARTRGRRRLRWLDRAMLVRTGEAFVDDDVARDWSPLAERVRAALDPAGVLV